MRIAYLDCFSGISGDMTIAALLDAGLKFRTLEKELAKLKVKGYRLKVSKVKRGAIAGTKFDCILEGHAHSHRSLKEILTIIDRSGISPRAKSMAGAMFRNIGEAEARIHGVKSADYARLHELGDIDSIVDIVGTAIGVDELGIDEVCASKVTLGRTMVTCAHGKIPIPAPATLELLKEVPVRITEIEAELVTPTGAGILKTLAKSFGNAPQLKMSGIGYGAGTMEFKDMPNMLRVLIGERQPAYKEDRIVVIESNIDDMNPQNFEYLFEKLFKEGALDVYTSGIQMKKSRPAFKLTVLVEPKDLDRISSVIFSETTTIGVRFYEVDRFKLDRRLIKVKTKYGEVAVKVSGGGGALTVSPEYDNCVKLAREKGVPLKVIYDEAKRLVKV